MKAGFIGLALLAAVAAPAMAQTGTVDRLYVMDCGHNAATDQSRWSPGVNVGKPIELSDNCYLIRHGSDWLLWDTGYPDAIAEKPVTGPLGTATRAKTLAAQLTEVGIKPADIKYVAVSHHHGDHIGNVDMFPDSTLLMQKADGYVATVVSGVVTYREGEPTGALPGKLVRGAQPRRTAW